MKKTHDLTHPRKKPRSILSFFLRMMCLFAVTFLGGCSEMVLFDPKGPVGETERFVILTAFALMLIVVIPVFIMAYWFSRKYRSTNTKAPYDPKWSYSGKIEFVIWVIPAIIVTCLGILTWNTTFRLDPYKPLDSAVKPITIEVVSLDWKWLFIYPEENIAVVSEVVFPADTPLNFRLTSDTVMTSFFIPQLGSQIYAMAGMTSRLHLLANEPGTYAGQNQQFSGFGYANMTFKAIATSPEHFAAWVQEVKKSPKKLDPARYRELVKPTTGYPVTYFSSSTPDLFNSIIATYHDSSHEDSGAMDGRHGSMPNTHSQQGD